MNTEILEKICRYIINNKHNLPITEDWLFNELLDIIED